MSKHRQSVFCVVRSTLEEESFGDTHYASGYVVGVYFSLERATEVAGTYQQLMLEQGFDGGEFIFDVQASTYYDE